MSRTKAELAKIHAVSPVSMKPPVVESRGVQGRAASEITLVRAGFRSYTCTLRVGHEILRRVNTVLRAVWREQ
jgi:hypothetical protein